MNGSQLGWALVVVAVLMLAVLLVGTGCAVYGCNKYYATQRRRLYPRARYTTLRRRTAELHAARKSGTFDGASSASGASANSGGTSAPFDNDAALALKTGDLLFFDAAAFSVMVKWTAHVPFSHIGVVVVIGGVPYIAEYVDGRSHYCVRPGVKKDGDRSVDVDECYTLPNGASLWPLEPRLRDYAGRYFVSRLSRPLSPVQEQKLARAALSDARPFAQAFDQMGVLVGAWWPRTLHCFQFASILLNAAGVPAEPLPCNKAYAPVYALCKCTQLELTGGRRYGPITEILCDFEAE